jgi:hypothetical protein
MKGFGYFEDFSKLEAVSNAVGKDDLIPDEEFVPKGKELSDLDDVSVPSMDDSYTPLEKKGEGDEDDTAMGEIQDTDGEGKVMGSAGTENDPGENDVPIYGGFEEALNITEGFQPGTVVDENPVEQAKDRTRNSMNSSRDTEEEIKDTLDTILGTNEKVSGKAKYDYDFTNPKYTIRLGVGKTMRS